MFGAWLVFIVCISGKEKTHPGRATSMGFDRKSSPVPRSCLGLLSLHLQNAWQVLAHGLGAAGPGPGGGLRKGRGGS